MSLWFDEGKQRWRVRIRRGGIAIAKTLPADASKRAAEKLHATLMRDVLVKAPRHDQLRKLLWISSEDAEQWERDIATAYATGRSWIHGLRAKMAIRHRNAAHQGETITAEELRDLAIYSRGRCAVSGIRLAVPGSAARPETASIDRIDCTKGYIEGNCRFVALAVNLAMQRWGDAAFRRICYGVVAKDYF